MKLKRIKLDKFVSGIEQRVFKTTTNKVNYNKNTGKIISYQDFNKDIWYGEYSTQKRLDFKISRRIK